MYYKECPEGRWQLKNHSTQDSRVVPHRGTNWAALRLTAQIGRDAVLSKSYGRGWKRVFTDEYICQNLYPSPIRPLCQSNPIALVILQIAHSLSFIDAD